MLVKQPATAQCWRVAARDRQNAVEQVLLRRSHIAMAEKVVVNTSLGADFAKEAAMPHVSRHGRPAFLRRRRRSASLHTRL